MVIKTDNDWEIANDKSGILMAGYVSEGPTTKTVRTLPIKLDRHAVHVMVNPVLGGGFFAYTPDDGEFVLERRIPKSVMNKLGAIDWHFRLCIVRIDLPPAND